MKMTSSPLQDAKSAVETNLPSTFGRENAGAVVPSGSMVDAVLTTNHNLLKSHCVVITVPDVSRTIRRAVFNEAHRNASTRCRRIVGFVLGQQRFNDVAGNEIA